MSEVFWETLRPFISTSLRSKALKALEESGMNRWVLLPGVGKAEREGRRIMTDSGKEYDLTPAQMDIILNIVSTYPATCGYSEALRGHRAFVDKPYLRVVLSKIKRLNPELSGHIKCEKWVGYRWV